MFDVPAVSPVVIPFSYDPVVVEIAMAVVDTIVLSSFMVTAEVLLQLLMIFFYACVPLNVLFN